MLLDKLKDTSVYNASINYMNNTVIYRKVIDVCLAILVLVSFGIGTGKVALPSSEWNAYGMIAVVGILTIALFVGWLRRKDPAHTVKASYIRSKEVQKHLDYLQIKDDYNFVGHFVMHNGTEGLGGYSFIKYSLTEFSAANGIVPDVLTMQNLPIVLDMEMVQSLLDNRCHVGAVKEDHTSYRIYNAMRINNYVACPVNDARKNLIGFVLLGNSTEITHDESELRKVALVIRQYATFRG